jgi:hypothetical protein
MIMLKYTDIFKLMILQIMLKYTDSSGTFCAYLLLCEGCQSLITTRHCFFERMPFSARRPYLCSVNLSFLWSVLSC